MRSLSLSKRPMEAMPELVEGRALKRKIMKGYMYILLCNDGSYYTGSTNDLERRMAEHFSGQGANHTKKHPPVKLLYYEEFQRIDEAFYREKQVQGWSRKKKEALINGQYDKLPELSKCYSKKEADTVAELVEATEDKVVECERNAVVELVETTGANPASE